MGWPTPRKVLEHKCANVCHGRNQYDNRHCNFRAANSSHNGIAHDDEEEDRRCWRLCDWPFVSILSILLNSAYMSTASQFAALSV